LLTLDKTLVKGVFFLCSGLIFGSVSCGRARKPIVVGTENETEQALVGEIVAQHLENRLQRKIERRLRLGEQLIVYQSVAGGDISIYPDYVGSIESVILKEDANADPAVALERTRNEILRKAQLELMDPLGYENPPVVVTMASTAAQANVRTLSDAAAGAFQWKAGMSYEFQQRPDVIPAVNVYKLPMSQGLRAMDQSRLFPALERGDVNMVIVNATNGRLISPEYRILPDDRKAFPPYQACLLVRADTLAQEPQLRSALTQLSGKFTTESVRKMSSEVDLDHREIAQVAAAFLASAGLK
jgi:osmoprotectant transport system substrate-binding protein